MEDEKAKKQEVGGVDLSHLRPPNNHPPGTVFAPPIKKRRRRKGEQHDSGWPDKPEPES